MSGNDKNTLEPPIQIVESAKVNIEFVEKTKSQFVKENPYLNKNELKNIISRTLWCRIVYDNQIFNKNYSRNAPANILY